MYICQVCKQVQPAGVCGYKIPTHVRTVEYRHSADHFTLGKEVAKEVMTCSTCSVPDVVVLAETKQVINPPIKKKKVVVAED